MKGTGRLGQHGGHGGARATSCSSAILIGCRRSSRALIRTGESLPLEWMLSEHATLPPDRGIFLPVSRRMHPDVCAFISQQVYEGRLTSHPDTAAQAVRGNWPRRAPSGYLCGMGQFPDRG